MLKIWKETLNKAQATSASDSTDSDVVTSGATEREPVDSLVRVTVPTQRPRMVQEASGCKRMAVPEDNASDEYHRLKRRKVSNSLSVDMIVLYEPSPTRSETELYTKLVEMKSDGLWTDLFRTSRRLLAELGPCAADLVRFTIFSSLCHISQPCIALETCSRRHSRRKSGRQVEP